jgi:hypothetical protein
MLNFPPWTVDNIGMDSEGWELLYLLFVVLPLDAGLIIWVARHKKN